MGAASASFQQRAGTHPQTAFQGPWALFRLLDQATLVPQSDTRVLATFKLNGAQARVVFGGGYVNTELRQLSEPRVFDFCDYITLDDGEQPLPPTKKSRRREREDGGIPFWQSRPATS